MRIHKEIRLGLTHIGGVVEVTESTRAKLVFTGQADLVAISDCGGRGYVIDVKTGRGKVSGADENLQLRGLAVLAARRWRLESVRVAIVQPWAGHASVADYDSSTLNLSRLWLLDLIQKVTDPDQLTLNAGDWCQYCKARISCEAFDRKALAIVESESLAVPADPEIARKALFARAAELSDAELAARYKALKMIGWYVSAVEGNVRIRAAEGGLFAENHFYIVEGKPKETIANVAAAWAELEKLGVSAEDFTAGCKTSKTAVKALVRKTTGLKGKALDAKVQECLQGAVKLGNPPQKLVAVGGLIEDDEDEENE